MRRALLFTFVLFLVYITNAALIERQSKNGQLEDEPPESGDKGEDEGNENEEPNEESPIIARTCGFDGKRCPGYTNFITLSDQTDVMGFCARNCKLDLYCASFAYASTGDSNQCLLYGQAAATLGLYINSTSGASVTYYDMSCPEVDQYDTCSSSNSDDSGAPAITSTSTIIYTSTITSSIVSTLSGSTTTSTITLKPSTKTVSVVKTVTMSSVKTSMATSTKSGTTTKTIAAATATVTVRGGSTRTSTTMRTILQSGRGGLLVVPYLGLLINIGNQVQHGLLRTVREHRLQKQVRVVQFHRERRLGERSFVA